MNTKKFTSIILIFILMTSVILSTGCARQPSNQRAEKIMEKYFKKYSKKFPESIIGKYPVQSVKVLHIEEVHKHMVAAYAILELEGGMAVQARFNIQKKPRGWKAESWENMGMATRQY